MKSRRCGARARSDSLSPLRGARQILRMCKVAILLSIQSVRCSRGATFMAFADYLRSSIRLAALARLPVIYIFTHDSVRKDSHEPRLSCETPSNRWRCNLTLIEQGRPFSLSRAQLVDILVSPLWLETCFCRLQTGGLPRAVPDRKVCYATRPAYQYLRVHGRGLPQASRSMRVYHVPFQPDLRTPRQPRCSTCGEASSVVREACALEAAELGGMTLEEIATRLSLTRERVRQIELGALYEALATPLR